VAGSRVVPAFDVERSDDVFVYVPPADAVTFTEMVHDPFAGIVPLLKRMPTLPAASVPFAEFRSCPPQVLVVVRGLATVIAPGVTGKTSVKPGLPAVRFTAFGFESVNVSVLAPPGEITAGEKPFEIVGRSRTVRLTVLLGVPAVCVWAERIPEVVFG
jgi:hypothetical protein